MCGIAGILNNGKIVLAEQLTSLQASLIHRGPDAQEIFISRGGQIGFAHTRLSILDLSPRAVQPMQTQDKRFTIVFNGEIYNFKKIRRDLEAEGETFLSDSDTEVILRLYQRKRENCLADFEGMYAFVIWDEVEAKCFFARDPFGIKPLYYVQTEESLIFASEWKSLRAAIGLGGESDVCGVESFLRKGSVEEPFSTDRRIRLLPAGHYSIWQEGKMQLPVEYATLQFPKKNLKTYPIEAATLTRNALLDSVKKHFVSDVEVGLFLSGGLDSTALLALSQELGQSRLATYTVGFKNLPDESELARRTSKHFGTRHHEIILDAEEVDRLIEGYLEATDQPTIDGFNVYTISKFAHEQGAKVVLSGLGGDELFGGYESLRAVPTLYSLTKNPAGKSVLFLAGSLLGLCCGNSKWKRLKEMAALRKVSLNDVYGAYRGIFTADEADKILEQLKISRGGNQISFRESFDLQWSLADQVDWLEWTNYLRNQLLRDADVFSMRFGLELRVPFVDFKLFKDIAEIPSSIRLNRKNLLKAAVPEIPEWILNQPKRGFLFPFSSWNILDRHFKNPEIKKIAKNFPEWYQKWALLQLDRLVMK